MLIFNIMYTDGYIQLVDKHLRETPISTTPFPNHINTCSTDKPNYKSGVIRKVPNTVVVPGFVAYPYIEDPFDDIDNQDKYLLHNYNNSPDAGFSFIFNGINNYYSQFCKYIPFVDGSTHMNSQLFNSYNQQLFVSIFNIINSYNNQRNTILNNINYLKYFYHLFPIHVEKFYWLFHRYVNPKIELLKSYLNELYSQNKSITSEIANLGETKGSIEKLSGQIKTNVTELNNKISSHDGFNSLVKAIKEQLEKSISELKALDKTEDINRILGEMVQQIQREASECHNKIKQTLSKHEENVKEKICKYIKTIKDRLDTQKTTGIPHIISKIEELVVNGTGGTNGRLSKMGGKMKVFETRHRHEINYLGIAHVVNMSDIKKVGTLKPSRRDENKIKDIKSILKDILKEIKDYLTAIQEIAGIMARVSKTKIEDYEDNIDSHVSKINIFNTINVMNVNFSKRIENANSLLGQLNQLKTLVGRYRTNFIEQFRNDVEDVASVTSHELRQINQDIKGQKDIVDKVRKQFNNTKFLFQYLGSFKEQKKTLEGIEMNGSELEKTDELINSMRKFRNAYRELILSVYRSSDTLYSKFERNGNKTTHSIQPRLDYLPKSMPLDRMPHIKLKNHIEKLEAIQSLNNTLTKIDSGMTSLNKNSQKNQDSNIEGALEYLKKIDGILTQVSQKTNSTILSMKITYEENKEQINVSYSRNGNEIQSHVASIGKIPTKIAELQSKVRYNIVLLNIAKSVNETLENVKKEARKFKWIEYSLGYIRHRIGDITERYGAIESDIPALSLFSWELGDLNKFKESIGVIKYLQMMLNENIKTVKKIKEWLKQSISSIMHYKKILLGISKEIAIGFSRVGLSHLTMPFVLVPNKVFGLGLFSIHGLGLSSIISPLLLLSIRIGFIMAHLSLIRMKLERILGSDLVERIEKGVGKVNCGITEVESSIESVIICFLNCSNKSITKNTKESTKRMLTSGDKMYNNEPAKSITNTQNVQGNHKGENIWTLLSNMCIFESKFVASRLYDCDTKTKEIKESLKTIYCECAAHIGCRNKPNCIKELPSYGDITDNFDESNERNVAKDDQNYICMCLVIRYVMYPWLMQCSRYIANMDYDLLSIIDRKFVEFNKSSTSDSLKSKLAWFFVDMTNRLWNLVKTKYLKGFEVYSDRVLHCFCRSTKDESYSYFISTMIYISFVVENIFNNQNETTGDSIQSLSALKAELEHIDSYPKRIFNKIIIKDCTSGKKLCGCNCECETKKGNCCCCICLYCCIVCVCICLACKICKSIKESCDNPLGEIKQLESVCKCDCGGKCWIKELLEKCKVGSGCDGVLNIQDLCSKCCEKPGCCCNELKEACKTSCEEIKKLCESPCKEKLEKCKDEKCVCCKLFLRSFILMLRFSKCVIKQIYSNVLLICLCCCIESKKEEIKQWIEQSNLSYNTNMMRGIRENRIVDSTSVINNKKLEGVSNNHYSYNDAYRINTSRAHGSLKYIIIKIVLIIIIVVMTIFIRVKIETDDDYKIDNMLGEENGGMCECSVENNENGVQDGNQINITYNNHKNNGTRKTSRTKGMKKKSLMIVMSVISGLYLNVVIRDLYVVLSLEYNVWSYFVSVVVCLGLTCSLLSRYCVHLYDFVYVLEQYGLKMSKVESLVDDKFGGETGTSMISSQFVMLYGLLKSVVGDLTSALSMSVSQSSYNEMKDALYPYKNMEGALHKMISGSDEYLTNLGKLRESVMESAIVGGCVDLYNVLDFLSYVLMSKTFFEFDEYQAYFHGNERYVAWRLGKSLNHNFFLVSYYRYSTIYSIDAQVQNLRLGEKHLATRNCMMLWRMFGEMEIELITLKSMCEESLDVPMTDIQRDMLKSRFKDEYLAEFQKFQLYVVSTLFNVREHKRVRTREIESSFPFADLFNEQMLDKARLSKLSAKYFDTNYRRLLSSMSLPTRTCDVSGHVEEVQRRVSAFCSHWLDLRYEYCKSIRSLGCEKAVNFAHDLVMSTLKEPEQIDTKITQMLANINLENIDFIQQLLETDETLKEKYQLKEFHNTLDTLTHIHPISDNYETTVLHYLNQYVISSLLNKDKIMLPLGIYLSWYGAALSEQHITHIHKYKYFIWIIFYIFNFLSSNLFPLLSMSPQVSK